MSKYEAKRPAEGFDDSGARCEVNVDKGWVNVTQECDRFGKDALTALSPEDARWLAEKLTEAANVAEEHSRWNTGKTNTCRKSIAGPPGQCLRGTSGCIEHKERPLS